MARTLKHLPAILLVLAASISSPGTADTYSLRLHPLFTDSAVLQRGTAIPVTGEAKPGATVLVSCRSQRIASIADAYGHWRAVLCPEPIGAPATLTVDDSTTGIVVHDIEFGDVWVASGQSNMWWPVSWAANAEAEIRQANHPSLRLFTVPLTAAPKPCDRWTTETRWVRCSPDTVTSFSAVAYFFGRDLSQHLGVPIGLIHASQGSTSAELWMSHEALLAVPDFRSEVIRAQLDSKDSSGALERYERALSAWNLARREGSTTATPDTRPQLPESPWRPGALFNGMIAPVTGFPIRGAIWYQVEGNAHRPAQFRELLPALISDWRSKWAQGDFPFLFVQMAGFQEPTREPTDHPFARIRESQWFTEKTVPKTGMATALDLGEIDNIHPKNKQEVGRRLALLARRIAYGQQIVCRGPGLERFWRTGREARLRFSDTAHGLRTSDGQKPRAFAVAGPDGIFAWADAHIDSDRQTVIVSSPAVSEPVAVRYGWSSFPETNLVNSEDLPALPFRTDTWPPDSSEKAAHERF